MSKIQEQMHFLSEKELPKAAPKKAAFTKTLADFSYNWQAYCKHLQSKGILAHSIDPKTGRRT